MIVYAVPIQTGLQIQFSNVNIQFLPPGIRIKDPILQLKDKLIFEAKEIIFSFSLFDTLIHGLYIQKILIQKGSLQLESNSSGDSQASFFSGSSFLHWDQLSKIPVSLLTLVDLSILVRSPEKKIIFQGVTQKTTIERLDPGYRVSSEGSDFFLKKREKIFKKPLSRFFLLADIYPFGVNIESIILEQGTSQLKMDGKMKGNLFHPNEWVLQTNLFLKGSLPELFEWIPGLELKEPIQGQYLFSGKSHVNLEHFFETLEADGTLEILDFQHRGWGAKKIQIQAGWKNVKKSYSFHLKKAIISSPLVNRVGGFQPGGGGEIEILPVEWRGKKMTDFFEDPFKLEFLFKEAHLHWLMAPWLKSIYLLDTRLNGIAQVSFLKTGKEWSFLPYLDLSLSSFQLDNQRYKQKKPLTKIFSILRPLRIQGRTEVNSHQLLFRDLTLSLPHTQLKVSGNVSKGIFDLRASGKVDLADLGKIAEQDVFGSGSIEIHVVSSKNNVKVFIDPILNHVSYLNLALGELRGRFIWDDEEDKLFLENLKLKQKGLDYVGNGYLDFHEKNLIHLSVDILNGRLFDLNQIFQYWIREIDLYPKTLDGALSGNVQIKGGLSTEEVSILAKMKGFNWTYLEEKFQEVFFDCGVREGGTFFIDHFFALKKKQLNPTQIFGNFSYGLQGDVDWNFEVKKLPLMSLDHFFQFGLPIKGFLDFKTSGKGKKNRLDYSLQSLLSQFSIGGTPYADSSFHLEKEDSKMTWKATLFGSQGLVAYESSQDRLEAQFKKLDLLPFLFFLNSKNLLDHSLESSFTGSLDLYFKNGNLKEVNGSISLKEFFIYQPFYRFKLGYPIDVAISDGSFSIPDLKFEDLKGGLTAQLKSQRGNLTGNFKGDFDPALFGLLFSAVHQINGLAKTQFSIGGDFENPTIKGALFIQDVDMRLKSFDSPIENLTGKIEWFKKKLTIHQLQGALGGGDLALSGSLDFSKRWYSPFMDFQFHLLGSQIKIYPFQRLKLTSDLKIHGESAPYLVEGLVKIDSALSREKILGASKKSSDERLLHYAPEVAQKKETDSCFFALKIDVESIGPIRVENDLFKDAELDGKLVLVNTLHKPKVLGTVSFLKGFLLFKDKEFKIQSGSVRFDESQIQFSQFDFSAISDIGQYKIKLFASGKLNQMKVELTSYPLLSESDILSLLATGMISGESRKRTGTDVSTVQQGEAASLVLHSLEFQKEIEQRTGFQFQLGESLNPLQGISAFRSEAIPLSSPQVIVSRKFSDHLSFSAKSSFGFGTNQANQFYLDYLVNPYLSITGVLSNYGSSSALNSSGGAENITIPSSGGIDLKFKKRFR